MSDQQQPENGHVELADEETLDAEATESFDEAGDSPPQESEESEEAAEAADESGEAEPDGAEASAEESGDESDEPEKERPMRAGPGEKLSDEEIQEQLFALIFAAAEPLSDARLVKLLQRPKPARVRAALEALGERLQGAGFPLELRSVAGGWQLFTIADQAPVVSRLVAQKGEEKVSPAALETLAVVAYRQPVTKAEIEAIRGVQAGPMLRSLVDRGLVRVTGRAEVPGSPLLYGTTKKFLDCFGLGKIEDLPRDGELVRD